VSACTWQLSEAAGRRQQAQYEGKAIGTSTGKGTSTNNARAEAAVKAKASAQSDTAQIHHHQMLHGNKERHIRLETHNWVTSKP